MNHSPKGVSNSKIFLKQSKPVGNTHQKEYTTLKKHSCETDGQKYWAQHNEKMSKSSEHCEQMSKSIDHCKTYVKKD